MQINIQYGAPGFWPSNVSTELNTAIQFMDRIFTNPVTITIDFGRSGVPAPWIPQNIGQPQYLPIPQGDLASNAPALIGSNGSFNYYNYTTVTADLLANANASGDSLQLQAANAALHYVPYNTNIHVIRPEAEALGIVGGDGNLDGYVGFSTTANFSYTPGNVSSSQYDFFAAVVHEVTEEMGRTAFGGTGNLLGFSAQNLYTVLDMFRYDAAGEANASNNSGAQGSTPSAWFSVDGVNPYGAGQFSNSGVSNNALQIPEYDLADWIPGDPPIYGDGDPIANDAFGAASYGIAPISEEDFAIMKALGWDTAVVTSADTVTVSAGETLSGYYVLNGGTLWVETGGVVSGTYYTNATAFDDNLPAPGTTAADGAGYGYIYGGTDVGAIVAAGGWQRVESVASAATIVNQGEQEVLSNGVALASHIQSGGIQQLDIGGSSVSATLDFLGLQDISGTALFTLGEGQQIVEPGAFAGFSRVESGGVENVYSGGATANTTIDSGGSEVVWIGGVATSTTVSYGGLETVSGTDSGAIIQRFGFEVVANGGTADGVTVSSGGTQTVYGSGTANATVVSNGGTQDVGRWGSASGSIISQGGNENLYGSDTYATVSSGGTQTVGRFGSASYALLGGGVEDVDSGGVTFGTTVDSGGRQVVSAGGAASSTQIFSGGNENVYGSAVTTYLEGGTQTIEDGGTGTGTDVISGIENVDSATALATLVRSGGELAVSSGGTAIGTMINLKGTLVVSSGGVASGTTVKSGGTELIEQGGVDSIAKVSGGSQYVNAGGAASGTLVGSGGVQIVSAGASATSAVFYSGGDQYVSAGGTAIGTTIRGGIELVLGTASGTMLRGGRLVAGGGGTLEGSTTIFGGTLEVQPGAAINGPIDFAGAGTLQIDGATMPTATIDGFAANDVIRLAGVSFFVSGGGSAVVSGHTLQITEHGSTYDLQLDPNASYANVTFTVFSESQPGTYVVLGPPPTTNDTTISSGETVSGLVVAAGATLTILPGGTADGTTIESGGTVNVEGTANGTVVDDGGNLVVLAGGVTNGTIVEDPGLETISAGGVSIDATLDGGEQYIESGGTASGATVGSASDQYVYAGGTASNTTVDGGDQVVYGTADTTTLNGTFATQFVYGSASATTIGFESYEYVETGGADSATIVGSAGLDFISSGGVTSGSEVMNGGNQYVYGSANNTTVDGGGVQSVQSGGVALNTLINGPGDQFVYSGGTASNTTVDGGVQVVYGAATSTTISGSFATQFVYGTAVATTIGFESYEYVEPGGADVGTIVAYAGQDWIYSGGATSNSEVMSFGNQYIYGSAIDTTVDTTGVQTVESGGNADVTHVASNGFQYVSAGGWAGDTTIDGGKQIVSGTASGTTVNGSFGAQDVYGSVSATTIGAFSFEYVETGGADSGTVVGNDGQQLIYAGGATTGAEIQSGGDEEVYGLATGTTVDKGGGQNVDSGGTAIDTRVGSAGVMYVSAGGTASSTILDGPQVVYGIAVDTTVNGSFGGQFVYGSATGTTIGSGSYDYVESGGADSGTFVSSGGLDLVYLGGTTVGTQVAGGEQDVLGSAIGTTVDGRGLVHVYSGGTTQGATVDSGSVERVDSGGTADGTTIAGGSLRLADGASLGGAPVTFAGPGGTLTVGGTAMPGNTISGFAVYDTIDLAGVTYDSSGTAPLEAGNVLAVLEGGQTYDLDFDPSQNFIGYGFALSPDSSSGTDITLVQQPITSAGAVSAGETVSNVSITSGGSLDVLPGGTAIAGMVSSGGTMNVSSGASADNIIIADGGSQYVLSGGTASNTLAADPGIQIISAGGSSLDATLVDGEQDVYGIASGTVIDSGGLEVVFSGGIDSGTAINGGGSEVVSSGGTVSGTVVDSGGTLEVLDGGTLAGYVVNDGTVDFDLTSSASFGGTLAGGGTLEVSGGGALDVTSVYMGSSQIDDNSTLEFASTYVGIASFSGSSTGPGGTLQFDADSIGPVNVVNPNDTVIAQPGSDNWINATVSYTLPSNIDALFLYAGTQGTGNSDGTGDALYALDAGNAQTLIGNSPSDTFVVYNSSDVVVPEAGSHDVVYAAVSYTLPTGVDTLILESTATQGVGNSDAAGDGLYAANPGQVATLIGNSASDTFVVYNSADVVVPRAGSHDVVYSAASYTLPTGIDVLIMEAGTQAVGNSDAAGDALYAANPSQVATLTGNSLNDTFVVYNSADVVVPKAGSHDLVYSAVDYTLPTGVDSLILEGSATQAVGNSDASGDTLYAGNPSQVATLTGNSHNDTFVVYNAADTVIGQANSTDTVYSAANFTLPTNVDTLFLEGPSAILGTGNDDAVDALFGNASVASTLVAGSGADILYVTGTAGTILTGGAGADTFAFPNSVGNDEVTNFGIAKDTLQFNASLFTNFSAAMAAATQVGANTVFTIDANDQVTLDNVSTSSLTVSNFHFT